MAKLLNSSDDSGPFIYYTLKNGNSKIILLFFFMFHSSCGVLTLSLSSIGISFHFHLLIDIRNCYNILHLVTSRNLLILF